jgi:hypothetical protein
MQEAIAGAQPDAPELYRGGFLADPVEVAAWSPPAVGSTFNMVGLSSFSSDEHVASNFSKGLDVGQDFWGYDHPPALSYVYQVESGGRALPASALSLFDQSEYITSGQFQVTGVEHSSDGGRESYRILLRQLAVWDLKA